MTSDTKTSDVPYIQWLIDECGLTFPKPIGGGRYAALCRYMYTTAIVTGRIGDMTSLDDRWCYHSPASAWAALDAWDGTGEPAGWHRHPASGRRVSLDANEMDEDGHVVGAVGVPYVRG